MFLDKMENCLRMTLHLPGHLKVNAHKPALSPKEKVYCTVSPGPWMQPISALGEYIHYVNKLCTRAAERIPEIFHV
jgi:hypothetical protein